jgi:hypothetical protein
MNSRSDNILIPTQTFTSKSLPKYVPTLGELHEKRLKNFKDYVNSNLSKHKEDLKLKQILIDFSNMPTYIFLGKVKELILPRKEDLTGLLKQMCTESEINFDQFDTQVISKIVRFLEYFCKVCEEYFNS